MVFTTREIESPDPVTRAARTDGLTKLLLSSLALLTAVQLLNAQWLSAPRPKFPTTTLKNGSEGSVTLRIVLERDGSVKRTAIGKSSGDKNLDDVAAAAVMKWRMAPASIKPSDLTTGRTEVFEFRQKLPEGAFDRNRFAHFETEHSGQVWMVAPFPPYPDSARRSGLTGTVVLRVQIGPDGRVKNVEKLQSSGVRDLDETAIAAVGFWRAHKQYAGQYRIVPITFGRRGR
jgi:TonB family protein